MGDSINDNVLDFNIGRIPTFHHVTIMPAAYGRWQIVVELFHPDAGLKSFSALTTDSEQIDKVDDFIRDGKIYKAYLTAYNTISRHIEDDIIVWLQRVYSS